MKYSFLLISFFILIISCEKKKTIPITKKIVIKTNLKKPVKQKKVKSKDSLNPKNAIAYFTAYEKLHKETKVRFKTHLGEIIIKLYKNTPLHRANFIFLVKNGYFDTTCFHRVVPNFIAQGGNSENRSTAVFRNKYKNYKIPPEFRKNRKHKRSAIASARDWDDNPQKLTTPFEFYIIVNKRGEHHLDNEHTVFGEIIKGMSVVDNITKLKTGEDEWPYNDVFIKAEIID